MEKWKVVGWRNIDFTDDKGRHVSGYSLFLARPGQSDDVTGLEVLKLFISKQYVNYDPVENQMIGINFNRYGKVQSIEVLG